MFKKISSWFYLRSVSKREEDEALFIWNTKYDEENNKFIVPYSRLTSKQISAILKIIDEELAKSYEFGLKLSRDHVLKEKAVVLWIINEMGNLDKIPKRLEFEEAVKIFSRIMREALKEELAFYFEKLGKERRVRSMYNCHLESVRDAVLHAIYNN